MRDPKFGPEKFVICHWDTFDDETDKVGSADTLEEAVAFVEEHYKGRLKSSGADRAEIVDENGKVVKWWRTG